VPEIRPGKKAGMWVAKCGKAGRGACMESRGVFDLGVSEELHHWGKPDAAGGILRVEGRRPPGVVWATCEVSGCDPSARSGTETGR